MSRDEIRVFQGEEKQLRQEIHEEVRLERIVFIGRTYEEYIRMFDLSFQEMIDRNILDCPAGACSFTAVANTLGIQVIAADIAYQFDAVDLEAKGLSDIGHAIERVEKVRELYNWNEFEHPEGLRVERTKALTETIQDMKQYPERYIPVVLPELPFQDQQFDLTLSAHFLFMYTDRLDYDFHLQTLKELMRVTREEIRIFPLVDQNSRKYEHMQELLDFAESRGWETEEREVGYEFQREARFMVILKKN